MIETLISNVKKERIVIHPSLNFFITVLLVINMDWNEVKKKKCKIYSSVHYLRKSQNTSHLYICTYPYNKYFVTVVPNWLVQYSYSFLYPAMTNNRFHLEIVHGNECDNIIFISYRIFP